MVIIISFERKELLYGLANERERKKERKKKEEEDREESVEKLRKNRCVTVHGVGSTDRDESCSLASL